MALDVILLVHLLVNSVDFDRGILKLLTLRLEFMSIYGQRVPFTYLFEPLFGHFRVLSCGNSRYRSKSFLGILVSIRLPNVPIFDRLVQWVLPLAVILGVLSILVDAYPARSPVESQLRSIVLEFIILVVLSLLIQVYHLAGLMTASIKNIRLIFQLLYFILHIVYFILKSFILCIGFIVDVVLLVPGLTQRWQESFVLIVARHLSVHDIS